MTPSLSPRQIDIQKALRNFLMQILPAETQVFEGQDNLVPEPQGANFVVMTVLRRQRLSTNLDTLSTGGLSGTIVQPTDVVIQLDVHSNDMGTASDMAQTISTMFRDDFAATFFQPYPGITPLYPEDPRQIAFMNAEQQYESRYVVDVHIQADQSVSVAQQSATTLEVGVVSVEAEYPA